MKKLLNQSFADKMKNLDRLTASQAQMILGGNDGDGSTSDSGAEASADAQGYVPSYSYTTTPSVFFKAPGIVGYRITF